MGLRLVLNHQKIVITGCNGFIGKLLTAKCLAMGCNVVGVVRNPTRELDVKGIMLKPIGEIGPYTDWNETLKAAEAVVHLAGISDTSGKKIQKRRLHQVNVEGTEHLALCAAHAGVRRFVFVSSIKVHGESCEAPVRETDPPNPFSDYAVTKVMAEKAIWEISNTTGMEAVILRPALVYGPGVKGGFRKLMDWVAKGMPLPLGAIKNRRSILFIDNLIEGIMAALTHPRAAGKTFLVADPEALSTPDLIRRLSHSLSVKERLYNIPVCLLRLLFVISGRKKEFMSLTRSLWADTSRIQEAIGWRPTASVETGIRKTALWFRENAGGSIG
ncbi:MAG: NAD-dependent epimerase/dehydratase family protein [Desulfobacterales bacterium]